MNTEFKNMIEKIKKLTENDLKNKSKDELLLSLIEEFGEVSREILIQEKIYGNTYKKPDEGPKGEAVDLFICATAMHFSENNDFNINFSRKLNNYNKVTDIMVQITRFLTPEMYSYDIVAFLAYHIFEYYNGTFDEFVAYANKKLNKWEWKCTQQ